MATYYLQRCYASILAVGDKIVTGAGNQGVKNQSYYDSMFGGANAEKTTEQMIAENKGIKIGSDAGTRTLGGKTVYSTKAPKMNAEEIAKTSYTNGANAVRKEVGTFGGATKNLFKTGGGKALLIGGGLLAAKGGYDLIAGKKKDN